MMIYQICTLSSDSRPNITIIYSLLTITPQIFFFFVLLEKIKTVLFIMITNQSQKTPKFMCSIVVDLVDQKCWPKFLLVLEMDSFKIYMSNQCKKRIQSRSSACLYYFRLTAEAIHLNNSSRLVIPKRSEKCYRLYCEAILFLECRIHLTLMNERTIC